MLPLAMLNELVTVKRRTSQGTDELNNPIYGAPTSGDGWQTVYQNMSVRIALKDNRLQFSDIGERVTPQGVMYYNPEYTLVEEDRILTPDGIEYVVSGIVKGYNVGSILDHYECVLTLP